MNSWYERACWSALPFGVVAIIISLINEWFVDCNRLWESCNVPDNYAYLSFWCSTPVIMMAFFFATFSYYAYTHFKKEESVREAGN